MHAPSAPLRITTCMPAPSARMRRAVSWMAARRSSAVSGSCTPRNRAASSSFGEKTSMSGRTALSASRFCETQSAGMGSKMILVLSQPLPISCSSRRKSAARCGEQTRCRNIGALYPTSARSRGVCQIRLPRASNVRPFPESVVLACRPVKALASQPGPAPHLARDRRTRKLRSAG